MVGVCPQAGEAGSRLVLAHWVGRGAMFMGLWLLGPEGSRASTEPLVVGSRSWALWWIRLGTWGSYGLKRS